MIKSVYKIYIKRILSSILFWWSIFGLLYTITQWKWWVFFWNEPLVVSIILWMSGVVFFSSIRVVAVRWLVSLLGLWLLLAVTCMVWVMMSYWVLSDWLPWLLKAISWVISVILIWLLIVSKRQAYEKYRQVSSTTINLVWIGTLWVWTAAVCALLTSMSIIKTPLTCEVVYDWYDKALESPLVPLHRSEDSLESLGEQSVFSFLNTLKTEEIDENNSDEDKDSFFLEQEWTDTQTWRWSLQSTFSQAKESLIDETLEQRSIVTQNVCQLVLDQIEEIRKTASWNISIVALLFVILSPIVTLWFRVIALLGWIVFKVLMVCGVFKMKKRLVIVSEVE